MKLKKARRYELPETSAFRNSSKMLTVDIVEGSNEPSDIMFLRWSIGLKWERIYILK